MKIRVNMDTKTVEYQGKVSPRISRTKVLKLASMLRHGGWIDIDTLNEGLGLFELHENYLRNRVSDLRKVLAPLGLTVGLDKSGRFKHDGSYYLTSLTLEGGNEAGLHRSTKTPTCAAKPAEGRTYTAGHAVA